MIKQNIHRILCIAALLLPTFLSAKATFPFYVGVGSGIARYVGDDVNDPLLLANQKAEDDRTFLEGYMGIDLGELLSIEVAYAKFDSVEETYETSSLSAMDAVYDQEKIEFDRFSLMAVAEYEVTLGLSVYATGGYAYYDFDRVFKDSNLAGSSLQATALQVANGDHGLEYGFGAKWEAIDRLFIRGQWSQSLINDRNVQTNRLSVEFHF